MIALYPQEMRIIAQVAEHIVELSLVLQDGVGITLLTQVGRGLAMVSGPGAGCVLRATRLARGQLWAFISALICAM